MSGILVMKYASKDTSHIKNKQNFSWNLALEHAYVEEIEVK